MLYKEELANAPVIYDYQNCFQYAWLDQEIDSS